MPRAWIDPWEPPKPQDVQVDFEWVRQIEQPPTVPTITDLLAFCAELPPEYKPRIWYFRRILKWLIKEGNKKGKAWIPPWPPR